MQASTNGKNQKANPNASNSTSAGKRATNSAGGSAGKTSKQLKDSHLSDKSKHRGVESLDEEFDYFKGIFSSKWNNLTQLLEEYLNGTDLTDDPIDALNNILAEILDLLSFREELLSNIQLSFYSQAIIFAFKQKFSQDEGSSFLALVRILHNFILTKIAELTKNSTDSFEVAFSGLSARVLEFYKQQILRLAVTLDPDAGAATKVAKGPAPVLSLEKIEIISKLYFVSIAHNLRLYLYVFSNEQPEQNISVSLSVPLIPKLPPLAEKTVTPDVWQEQQRILQKEADIKRQAEEELLRKQQEEEERLLEQQIADIKLQNLVNPLEILAPQEVQQVIIDIVNSRLSSFVNQYDRKVNDSTAGLLKQLENSLRAIKE